ncbi:MAG: hypothetical protein NTU61_04065 [Candidatus Altiarchaeota archaeon]|nr:hypothetical protein [Candidatus Altiarchaeota archaeon]
MKPTSKYYCSVVAAVGADDIEAFRLLRDVLSASQAGSRVIQDSGVFTLLSSSDSFIVGAGASKTVIAGYPWFGEWGRDSMISLPGLALIRGRFEDAESVLDRFMNKIYAGRIPTNFEGGKPKYYDFDGTLWMIDRVKDYLDYVGIERGRHFLHTHWWSMKDVIKSYSQNVKDGILRHKSGTWMDTLRRDDAVEVQGLWYNALKTMEALSEMMGEGVDYHEFVDDFESNFMDKFWKGSFFSDTLSDGSLRPNQVIMLSMDYSMVPKENALEALKAVKEGLLTPYGLRTLSKSHQDYAGRYSGSPAEREKAYHNGSVWPWLLGPYVKACVKYGVSRDECVEALKPLLTTHLSEAGLGTISELFDGDEPHTPRGCVSQAWSVAEVLRAYYEDVGNRKLVF